MNPEAITWLNQVARLPLNDRQPELFISARGPIKMAA
jgi:hypothetical protein